MQKLQNGRSLTLSRTKEHKAQRLRHVALIVESAVAPRRMMLSGVARYIQEHEPWAIYLKPFGVEQSLPNWLRDWHGDGIIAAGENPTPAARAHPRTPGVHGGGGLPRAARARR